MMQLYYSPGACSLAPHIVCEWLKVPYTLVLADRNDPVFQRINPLLAVPALVSPEIGTLTQCGAILRYLCTLPGGAVLGADPLNASEVRAFDFWECFLTGDVHPSFFPFFGPQRFTTDSSTEALAHVRAASPALVERVFQVLDTQLAGQPYIVGERLSIMDAYATPMLRWAKTGLPATFDKFPHLMRYYQSLCQNPGVLSAMAQQEIKP